MKHDQPTAASPEDTRTEGFSARRLVRLIRGKKGDSETYTRGPIAGTMIRTALVMLPGTLAISGYNLVDAYFVGQLDGDAPMAAIGASPSSRPTKYASTRLYPLIASVPGSITRAVRSIVPAIGPFV